MPARRSSLERRTAGAIVPAPPHRPANYSVRAPHSPPRSKRATGRFPRPTRLGTLDELKRVWLLSPDATRQNRAAGIDGQSLVNFRNDLTHNLEAIRARLLRPSFRYRELRPFAIPKEDGGVRIICLPTIEDALIQRWALAQVYDPTRKVDRLKVELPTSFGTIKGKGVAQALKECSKLRQTHPWALRADISKFFDRIRRDELKERLYSKLGISSITPFVVAAIDAEARPSQLVNEEILRSAGLRKGEGVRQGMPLSSILATFVLRPFDDFFVKRKVPIVRYADDFMLFAKTKADMAEIRQLAMEQLDHLGHSINPRKVSEIEPEQPSIFLGAEIRCVKGSYKAFASREAVERMKENINVRFSMPNCTQFWSTFPEYIAALNSTIEGYKMHYRFVSDYDSLCNTLRQIKTNALLNLLVACFGSAAVKSLKAAHKDFLCVNEY